LFRINKTQLYKLRTQIQKMLQMKYIRPSVNLYAANVLFVKKKSGK